jgi:uncharacterized membrane protein YfcA
MLAGAAIGVLLAVAGLGVGVRPRPWLRAAGRAATGVSCLVALAASAFAAEGVLRAEYSPPALAATCVGVALLIAFAAWLLSVEPDDGGYPLATPDEPEWWPAFEREFEEWTRGRAPVGGRK